ncbi:energy-coupling factor transporter transmembrane component T [Fictibacillus sp. UD]|uniref:energy-coupling factor transporter transmembrane component T family protein n=1 Tax=Fictibacillus sp. UD TaxID=3038777 RepID=UPI00374743FD
MNTVFRGKGTWLHKINPSLKLLTMMILFVFAITIHQLNFMIGFSVVISLLFLFGTGYSYKHILLLLIPFLLIFLSTSSSMILFGKGETTLFKWAYVHITEESLLRGIHLGFRALSFAMLSLTFVLTTQPVKLFYSLMQQLKLSPKYAYSFMAAIRLIPILIEEFQTIRNAQKVRGVIGYKNPLKRLQHLVIPLLSQSIRRAHRIAVAMEAKRFDSSKKRTFYYEVGFSKFDSLFVSYFLIMFTLAYIFSMYFPLFSTDVRF